MAINPRMEGIEKMPSENLVVNNKLPRYGPNAAIKVMGTVASINTLILSFSIIKNHLISNFQPSLRGKKNQ